MRSGAIPFQFDLSDMLGKARRRLSGSIGDVTLNLPFVSIAVSPKDRERVIARELIIRLSDRRVLSSHECCDGCIDGSLASLQEIRQALVEKQVELSKMQDGPLYLLIDMMRQGIRQFQTYEERLRVSDDGTALKPRGEFWREPEVRQHYFDALELLRAHISRCLVEAATIGGVDPAQSVRVEYQGAWPLDRYLEPKSLSAPAQP